MKLIHLSDLHLGKRVSEFPMLEDQAYILDRILEIIDAELPRAVLIAGDVYDKPVPSAEAVQLFDDFLCALAARGLQVFVISGNHDSPERIAFGGRLMGGAGVHLSPVYGGCVEPIELSDEFGPVRFYLLPFLKPASVRRFCPDAEIESYTDAIRAAVARMEIDSAARNVLVAHQFVAGAERCESEDLSVGGVDAVDAAAFEPFDYVALGHLHGAQSVTRPTLRYCGTPLKYSFSERRHAKSVTVAELGEKGCVDVRAVPLVPRHDLRELRGSYEELTLRANYEGTAVDDYLHVVLTDERDVPDAVARLRSVYPNLMQLSYDNARTRSAARLDAGAVRPGRSGPELFAEFYEKQNGSPLSAEQARFVAELFERIGEAEA